VLVTGEPGSGKTWLARRLVEKLPAHWCAVRVDVTETLDHVEFLRLVGHALGRTMSDRLGAARLMLAEALQDQAAEGRLTLLILDEAQRGGTSLWQEIHTLASQLGRLQGFAAMVILGQTALARQLWTGHLDAFGAALSLHVHLMPVDLDEARELLGSTEGAGAWDDEVLEDLHRDSRGNLSRLLQLAWTRPRKPGRNLARDPASYAPASRKRPSSQVTQSVQPRDLPTPSPDRSTSRDPAVQDPALPLIPSKPPIRFEDGLVEVGWEGDLEGESALSENPPSIEPDSTSLNPSIDEELVEDRYAALQAWAEWSRNRQRSEETGLSTDEPNPVPGDSSESMTAEPDSTLATPRPTPAASLGNYRAEASSGFAPYHQLFTRLRQSRT
jgi:general secretion pathway protein A